MEWFIIDEYKGLYSVSACGQVRRNIGFQCKKERLLRQYDNGNGYKTVSISIDGFVKREYVHRLVAKRLVRNTSLKKEVNHLDGDKGNNNCNNLEWCTRSENQIHRYTSLNHKGANTGKTGSLNGRSKKVYQYTIGGVFVKMYDSVLGANRDTGICESSIRGCVYGKQNHAGGFKWKYNRT